MLRTVKVLNPLFYVITEWCIVNVFALILNKFNFFLENN